MSTVTQTPPTRQTLEVLGLTKRLGSRIVVDQACLSVGQAEIVGLLGPNGAGKTTIFNLIMGLLRPDRGEIRLGGVPLSNLATHQRARLGLGYLPQEASIFRGLSTIGNIQAALQIHRKPMDLAASLLASFGLTERAHQRADTLSGGERRKLELARLMAGNPRFVLLDEPFKGLDAAAIAHLVETIAHLASQHVGFLLTDHAVAHALSLCQRTYIIEDGRVVSSGTQQQILRHSDHSKEKEWLSN